MTNCHSPIPRIPNERKFAGELVRNFFCCFLQQTGSSTNSNSINELSAELVPEIIYFFYFRLESVAVVIADGLEDPLDDVGMVTQQLDQISGEF